MLSWGTHSREKYAEQDAPKRYWSSNIISFFVDDLQGSQTSHDDAIIVAVTIANYDVKKNLIDNRSSANILIYNAFVKMNLSLHQLRRTPMPLVRFGGNSVGVKEEITLLVTIGTKPL